MLKCEILRGMPPKIKKSVEKILVDRELSLDDIKFSITQFREDLLMTLIYEEDVEQE